MGKKRLQSLSKKQLMDDLWKEAFKRNECPYGCELKTYVCDHFNEVLPKPSGRSVKPKYVRYLDSLSRNLLPVYQGNERSFRTSLKPYGLADELIQLLVDKFVYNKSYREIEQEHQFESIGGVYSTFRMIFSALKAKGYKLPNADTKK